MSSLIVNLVDTWLLYQLIKLDLHIFTRLVYIHNVIVHLPSDWSVTIIQSKARQNLSILVWAFPENFLKAPTHSGAPQQQNRFPSMLKTSSGAGISHFNSIYPGRFKTADKKSLGPGT